MRNVRRWGSGQKYVFYALDMKERSPYLGMNRGACGNQIKNRLTSPSSLFSSGAGAGSVKFSNLVSPSYGLHGPQWAQKELKH